MANYSTLKASVNAYIKANGVRAITGPVLNGILTQMINTLGDGARFAGVATPAGNPGTVDNVVFYLAFTAGTYTNYGGVTLDGSTLHVLVYDGTWNDIDLGAPTSLAMTAYAKIDGYYQSLVAGAAENLVGHGTVPAEFIFRTSGGSMDIGTGAAGIKSIKGKSLVWNQLCPFTSTPTMTNATWTNNTLLATAKNGQVFWNAPADGIIAGHKYIQIAILKTTAAAGQIRAFSLGESISLYNVAASGSYQVLAGIGTANQNLRAIAIRDTRESDWDAIEVAGVMLIDLTLMFGEGKEPATVEEFEALFPKPYYAYNAGTLISNDAESLETVGFNLFDPETGKAKLLGGQSDGYQITGTYSALSFTGVSGETSTITPDANGKFNVTENGELTVTGGNTTDTCVHLVWSGYRNGEYEPYELHTAALGLNALRVTDGTDVITVNGLKANGSDYDEVIPATKKYVKRIGVRSYAEGDESDATVTTDGTTTYYTLETPVEYDLVDDIPASYYVNDFGTERAVAPEGATLPSAPFSEEVRYAMNAVDQLRRMPEQYVSADSLENLLEALKTAGIISAYTMTWNSTTQEYSFTVTAPVEPTPEP